MCAKKGKLSSQEKKREGQGQRDNKISTQLYLTKEKLQVKIKPEKGSIRILERSARRTEVEKSREKIYIGSIRRIHYS